MPQDIPPDELADEDDELDGTGVDYKADPVIDDDELIAVILSPEGDPDKVHEYARQFGIEA